MTCSMCGQKTDDEIIIQLKTNDKIKENTKWCLACWANKALNFTIDLLNAPKLAQNYQLTHEQIMLGFLREIKDSAAKVGVEIIFKQIKEGKTCH